MPHVSSPGTRSLASALLALTLWGAAAPAFADDGDQIDLDSLFNTAKVGIATRHEESTRDVPAVVDVITADQIRERGYTSVAEALQMVPGFYVTNDQLLPSVGVRGIASGQRAWSQIVKVMIDGQPVPFRIEGANWLGPELIPIDLVSRIEIIRGPASALYGADAFLGVINVVTKRGSAVDGAHADAGGGVRSFSKPLGMGELDFGTSADPASLDLTLGASTIFQDLSGLSVPAISPLASQLAGQLSAGEASHPSSLFGRASLQAPLGIGLTVDSSYQRLEGPGEFQDWAPMTHQNQIGEQNGYVRAQARKEISRNLSWNGSFAYSLGTPTADDVLSVGRSDYVIKRQFSAEGWDLATEFDWLALDKLSLTAGADWTRNDDQLPTNSEVFLPGTPQAGQSQIDGTPGPYELMENLGLYLQGTYYPLDALGVTLNLRDDQHNIYGNNLSTRAGLVYRLSDAWTAKALYGTSFKAPSPLELFGKPLIFGDILGNPQLKPEYASTLEGALIYALAPGVDLSGNLYWMHVSDQISFETLNGNPYAVNLGQTDSAGIEASCDWKWRFLHGTFNTSLQKTVPTLASGFADPNGVPEPYPYWMANAGVGSPIWRSPFQAWLEARYVGWVPSSQQNYAANGHTAYELPPAFLLDFTITNTDFYLLGDRPTTLALKIENLLDSSYVQPGYGGVDYPGLGRTITLRLGRTF